MLKIFENIYHILLKTSIAFWRSSTVTKGSESSSLKNKFVGVVISDYYFLRKSVIEVEAKFLGKLQRFNELRDTVLQNRTSTWTSASLSIISVQTIQANLKKSCREV